MKGVLLTIVIVAPLWFALVWFLAAIIGPIGYDEVDPRNQNKLKERE